MGTGEFNAGGNPAMDWHPIQGGVEIFLVASCYRNPDKLQPDGPLGSYADLLDRALFVKNLQCFLQSYNKSLIDQACSGPYWENIGPRYFFVPINTTENSSIKFL